MIDRDPITQALSGSPLVRSVDILPKGHVRIETIFLYPDGSSVDVFVKEEGLFQAHTLSDLGQTMAWLMDVQVKPWTSKKRQRFVEDALRLYNVELKGGALETGFTPTRLSDDIVRLGQACVRVSDLLYTRRTSLQAGVTEEIEEVLAETDWPYEADVEMPGKLGNLVRLDFLVHGPRRKSAILALSSPNTTQAHAVSNEIFRKWYDLKDSTNDRRITVFDDRYDTYRGEDLRRLGELSEVLPLSGNEQIVDALAA